MEEQIWVYRPQLNIRDNLLQVYAKHREMAADEVALEDIEIKLYPILNRERNVVKVVYLSQVAQGYMTLAEFELPMLRHWLQRYLKWTYHRPLGDGEIRFDVEDHLEAYRDERAIIGWLYANGELLAPGDYLDDLDTFAGLLRQTLNCPELELRSVQEYDDRFSVQARFKDDLFEDDWIELHFTKAMTRSMYGIFGEGQSVENEEISLGLRKGDTVWVAGNLNLIVAPGWSLLTCLLASFKERANRYSLPAYERLLSDSGPDDIEFHDDGHGLYWRMKGYLGLLPFDYRRIALADLCGLDEPIEIERSLIGDHSPLSVDACRLVGEHLNQRYGLPDGVLRYQDDSTLTCAVITGAREGAVSYEYLLAVPTEANQDPKVKETLLFMDIPETIRVRFTV